MTFTPFDRLRRHERLFYLFVATLATILLLLSLLGTHWLWPEFLVYLLRNVSTALLPVSLLFFLRKWLFEGSEDAKLTDIVAILGRRMDALASSFGPLSDHIHQTRAKLTEAVRNELNILARLDGLAKDDSLGRCYTHRREFYEHYYRMIQNSHKSVLLIGDGFACHNTENRDYAEGLCASIRVALENNATVKRFQFSRTLSLQWLRMLTGIKARYGELFQVYLSKERDPLVMPYVICVVDQGMDNSSAMIMLTLSADTTLEEKLAGPAFMFEKQREIVELVGRSIEPFFDREIALSTRDMERLLEETEREREEAIRAHIDGIQDVSLDETEVMRLARLVGILDVDLVARCLVRKLEKRHELYFAYGSNMDPGRMQARCHSAKVAGLGYLNGFRLVFNMFGRGDRGERGGIANVVTTEGDDQVWGVLYHVRTDELQGLDTLEASMGYSEVDAPVETEVFGPVFARVYVGHGKGEVSYEPSAQYREHFLRGVDRHEFPLDYKDRVRALVGEGGGLVDGESS